MAQSDTPTAFRPAHAPQLNALDWLSLILMVIGSVNWGLVGALDLDLVGAFLGPGTMASRLVYMLVGLAGLYGVVVMVRLGRSVTR
jgi:uncharacterized membrane protein YuzA (DUF378 family)